MKVLVVGAAGKTGRAVVDQAIKAGHEVTAFVHRDGYDVPGVAVQVGDASDTESMAAAVTSHDAVVDTIGGKTPDQPTTLETDVATAIVAAMQHNGVRRLVVTSVVGEGDSIANTPASIKELMETVLRGSTRDKAGMEDVVRASGLGWIITRSPVLNDEPATGNVRVLSAQSGELAHSITPRRPRHLHRRPADQRRPPAAGRHHRQPLTTAPPVTRPPSFPGFPRQFGGKRPAHTGSHCVQVVTASSSSASGSTPMPAPVGTCRCPSARTKGSVMSVW